MPTKQLTVNLKDLTDTTVGAGVLVKIEQSSQDQTSSTSVVKSIAQGRTDASGQVLFNIIPSVSGSQSTLYQCRALDSDGNQIMVASFQMPDSDSELNDIVDAVIVDSSRVPLTDANETITGTWTFIGGIDLSGSDLTLNELTLNEWANFALVAAPDYLEGRVFYSLLDHALSYYNEEADVTINIGQENVIRARNASGALIEDGKVVYISGSTGEDPQITKAIAGITTPTILGVSTHDIEDNSFGYVTTIGIVRGINTTSWSAGDVLYLSASVAGEMVNVDPGVPNATVEIGVVVKSAGEGKIYVHPQRTYDEVPACDVIMDRITGSTYSTAQEMQDVFHSAGWIEGGGITNDLDGTISVAAGNGLIRATNSPVATIFFTDWLLEAGSNVDLVDDDNNWIYVEYNSGSPRVIATNAERTDFNTNILLATIFRSGTELHITEAVKNTVGDHALLMIQRLKGTAPFARESGGSLAETGTLNFSISAGVFWEGLTEFTTDEFDSGASPADEFTYYYLNNLSAWIPVVSQTDIDNINYNDIGSGTLTALTANRYGVHWVYLGTDSDVAVIYGVGDYTLAQANGADAPGAIPPELTGHARLIGKIIVRKSAVVFTSVESSFETAFEHSDVNNHNDLTGIQGGAAGDYNHLTTAQLAQIDTNTANTKQFTRIAQDATTNRDLELLDAGGLVEMTSASAKTFTILNNATIDTPLKTLVYITDEGAGQTTITAGSGVTVQGDPKISAQYQMIAIYQRAADDWRIIGGVA